MTMLTRAMRAVALTALIGGFGAAAVWAQTDAPEENPVLARVDGEEIRQSDLAEALTRLPPQARQLPPQVLVPALLEQVINARLVGKAAEAADLRDDPEVQERLSQLQDRIVQEVYLTREVEERLTPERLQTAYEEYLAANPPEPEVKASHILLETEEEAKKVIEELQGGADFATLAKERSTDPSAQTNAGDLGYFTEGTMVEPFAKAAFAMEPGTISETPVETQFGWHVIKVEDKRTPEPPTFEAMRPQLERQLSDTVIQEIVEELRQSASIEMVEAAPAEPAAPAGETPKAQ